MAEHKDSKLSAATVAKLEMVIAHHQAASALVQEILDANRAVNVGEADEVAIAMMMRQWTEALH